MKTIQKTIKEKIPRSKNYLQQSLILWDKVGYDRTYGGYFEALNFDGTPLTDLDKRFRIHPRTIFSHAAGTVLGYYDGLAVAEEAFEHIISHWWLKEGGFATRANRQGEIVDDGIYTYDHSFRPVSPYIFIE